MSSYVFRDVDTENNRGNARTRRTKVDDLKTNAPKPSKRAALGTITNVTAARVQPHRNAKGSSRLAGQASTRNDENIFSKATSSKSFQIQSNNQPFSIHVDDFNTKRDTQQPIRQTELSTEVSSLARLPLANITSKVLETSFEDCPMVTSDSDDCVVISSGEVDRIPIESAESRLSATDSEFGASEYAQDIHKYMKASEKKNRPKVGYMRKQTDINDNMRMILVDWLVEVAEEYKLMPQTLYLTVNYIDRFLSVMSVLRGNLQLVGTACMLVASKFEEIYPPEVSEFVYITDDTYTAKQVLRMEHLILKALNFDISVPTVLCFVDRYITVISDSKETQVGSLAKYLCELSLLEASTYLQYLPSVIAASALAVSLYANGKPFWTPTLSYFTDFQLADIQSCVLDIHRTFVNAPQIQQQSIKEKYSSVKYHQASQLIAPINPPL